AARLFPCESLPWVTVTGSRMYTAKKPPPRFPSRARGKSMWPSDDRSRNERPVFIKLSTVSLCPSKIGGLDACTIVVSLLHGQIGRQTAPERQSPQQGVE